MFVRIGGRSHDGTHLRESRTAAEGIDVGGDFVRCDRVTNRVGQADRVYLAFNRRVVDNDPRACSSGTSL
jgi:hypothetical protein